MSAYVCVQLRNVCGAKWELAARVNAKRSARFCPATDAAVATLHTRGMHAARNCIFRVIECAFSRPPFRRSCDLQTTSRPQHPPPPQSGLQNTAAFDRGIYFVDRIHWTCSIVSVTPILTQLSTTHIHTRTPQPHTHFVPTRCVVVVSKCYERHTHIHKRPKYK